MPDNRLELLLNIYTEEKLIDTFKLCIQLVNKI